jgi:hypothetical protein
MGPLSYGLAPQPLPYRPSAVGRPESTSEPPVEEGEKAPLFPLIMGQKAMGAGPLARLGLTAFVDEAQWHSAILGFPFRLIQFNFQIEFKLLKFIET